MDQKNIVSQYKERVFEKFYDQCLWLQHYFRYRQKEGVWNKNHDYLRAEVRRKANRNVEPSARIVNSQSVATGDHGSAMDETLV